MPRGRHRTERLGKRDGRALRLGRVIERLEEDADAVAAYLERLPQSLQPHGRNYAAQLRAGVRLAVTALTGPEPE